jgi:probable F420-dependent oxidoreductase
MVEEAGLESVWFPDHTHMPAVSATQYPGGQEMPAHFARLIDPVVAIATAASSTRTVKLGFGVCLVVERDPIVCAKQVASLDLLSGGRILLGVGAGWNREELRNHGVDPRIRMRLLIDRVRAMEALWTQEVASYKGTDVSFEGVWSWPKPVQHPHPPVLLGGVGPTVFDRVDALGCDWFPSLSTDADDDALLDRIRSFRRERANAGSPPSVSLNAARPEPSALRRYEASGIARCVFDLPSTPDVHAIEARLATVRSAIESV